jgi:hypothetical protein
VGPAFQAEEARRRLLCERKAVFRSQPRRLRPFSDVEVFAFLVTFSIAWSFLAACFWLPDGHLGAMEMVLITGICFRGTLTAAEEHRRR